MIACVGQNIIQLFTFTEVNTMAEFPDGSNIHRARRAR